MELKFHNIKSMGFKKLRNPIPVITKVKWRAIATNKYNGIASEKTIRKKFEVISYVLPPPVEKKRKK